MRTASQVAGVTTTTRRAWPAPAAATLLGVSAGLHLALVPEHLSAEMVDMGHGYIGWLFLASVVACTGVAVWVGVSGSVAAWTAAIGLCGAMIAALLASRTVGLPNGYLEAWEPAAVWSLIVETVVLVLAVVAVTRSSRWGRSWHWPASPGGR